MKYIFHLSKISAILPLYDNTNENINMNVSDSTKYNQARRILHAFNFIASNGLVSLKEIGDFLFPDLPAGKRREKNRSIQRIADILVEEGLVKKIIKKRNEGNLYEVITKPINYSVSNTKISGNESLAFHFVKAFMNTFKGTTLANQFERLNSRIEAIAPDEYIPEDELLKLQLPGAFDFSIKSDILNFLIKKINNKEWLRIKYRKQFNQQIKESEIYPQMLTLYEGIIFLIAYNPNAKKYLTYSVYNILNYEEAGDQNRKAPSFDFDKFQIERFAVIDGEPKSIKLTIKSEMAKYFENRFWHITQKVYYDKNENLKLELVSPFSPDLITWIIRWSEAIIKIRPIELKEIVIKQMKANIIILSDN